MKKDHTKIHLRKGVITKQIKRRKKMSSTAITILAIAIILQILNNKIR